MRENPPVWLSFDRHNHWAGQKPDGLSPRDWNYFGDRYPGSRCRWWTDHPKGQEDAQRLRSEYAQSLCDRVDDAIYLIEKLVSA
jgi:hypothetical protein